jgi:hypothetical protein
MTEYKIQLTQTEDMALAYVCVSQQEWMDNAIKHRCLVAINNIVEIAVEKSVAENVQLPTTKEGMVALAFEKGWVKTGAQRNAEYEAMRATQQGA